MVLVEGITDADVLAHAARVLGLGAQVRFNALRSLDVAAGGNGADQMARYVKDHAALLGARPLEAPFIILFDWDVLADVAQSPMVQCRAAYQDACGRSDRVLRMNGAEGNPDVSADLKGIERFYPTGVFASAEAAGELTRYTGADGVFNVGAAGLSQLQKAQLRQRMLQTLESADFQFLKPTLKRIVNLADGAAKAQATLDAQLVAEGIA